MAKGSWSATSASGQLVPANAYRDKLIIQMNTSDPCSLGFGEAAVFDEGIRLRTTGTIMIVTGELARKAIYGICDTNKTATGGYQEGLGSFA